MHEYTNLLEYDFGTTDGFKKRLLKWKNQIVDFQKATGEVFSDRLKCAIVLSRSPAPIRTYLRVQNRGDYGALRVALMNYLEAEDDGHGPVPMEVGAMKGKKGDKGKKGYGKGKFGKSLGKYDRSNEHSKIHDYGKDMSVVDGSGRLLTFWKSLSGSPGEQDVFEKTCFCQKSMGQIVKHVSHCQTTQYPIHWNEKT